MEDIEPNFIEDKIYFIEDEIPRYQRNLYLKKKFNSKIKLI